MNIIKNNRLKVIILLLTITLGKESIAQVAPHKTQFFENNALINPAYVGAKATGSGVLTYASQWNKVEGSPKVISAVINTPLSEKSGIGISFLNDKAGLINRTTVLAAYSYKVRFNETSAIRFGLGAGLINDKFSRSDINSPNSSSDPAFNNYNNRHGLSWKAVTGAIFTNRKFEAQLSWHDLNNQLSNRTNTVNDPGLTASVSYKINLLDSVNFRSLVGIRQVNGYGSYYDIGFNAEYLRLLNLTALYHTNKSLTFGLGLNLRDRTRFVFLYGTQSSQQGSEMGESYEILLAVPFRLKR
ncbi:PorP/SprF family type IX secretion system membrane protein [Pedobacter miscanthi]|uniref:PorP/SprF family type IX secretion system membrane protein n=1 Tax=Pedobacter miscanthi TaxID=2259170 RepID=UPI00292E6AD8|nr:PorP/SprF family type IX secretion system membrane protein [Pedobacter miscanthi]